MTTLSSLQQIAAVTGALHYVAGSAQALQAIIQDIGRLEASIPSPDTRRQKVEWYWLALLAAVVLLAMSQALMLRQADA